MSNEHKFSIATEGSLMQIVTDGSGNGAAGLWSYYSDFFIAVIIRGKIMQFLLK